MKKIILIVDDAKLTQQMVSFSLAELGCQLEIAGSGSEALQKLQEDPVDLLIIDYMMPEMTGMEVVQELRRREIHSSLPIIMLTSRGQRETETEATHLSISCFLTKPFSPTELAGKVKDLLQLQECAVV